MAIKRSRAVYARPFCECGFFALAEHIPFGTEYVVRPDVRTMLTAKCGGCGKTGDHPGIFVEGDRPGFLPAAIFDIDEGEL